MTAQLLAPPTRRQVPGILSLTDAAVSWAPHDPQAANGRQLAVSSITGARRPHPPLRRRVVARRSPDRAALRSPARRRPRAGCEQAAAAAAAAGGGAASRQARGGRGQVRGAPHAASGQRRGGQAEEGEPPWQQQGRRARGGGLWGALFRGGHQRRAARAVGQQRATGRRPGAVGQPKRWWREAEKGRQIQEQSAVPAKVASANSGWRTSYHCYYCCEL